MTEPDDEDAEAAAREATGSPPEERSGSAPAEASERPHLDARGRERPSFLLHFPRDPRLEALMEAFEQGDYARVRRDSQALLADAPSDEVRRAAEELRRRTNPDPVAVYLLMLGVALLSALVLWTYLRHG